MYIISVFVNKRFENVEIIQKVLTFYGEKIVARLGIHDIGPNKEGLIIIVYKGKNVSDFVNSIEKIQNLKCSYMAI